MIKCFMYTRITAMHNVVLDGQTSDPVPVLSGMPQGSVLGQIPFLIFINDIPDNMCVFVCSPVRRRLFPEFPYPFTARLPYLAK